MIVDVVAACVAGALIGTALGMWLLIWTGGPISSSEHGRATYAPLHYYDGFFVCREHGAVAVQRNVQPGGAIDSAAIEVLDDRLPAPKSGAAVECFCGRPLNVSLRRSV
jgi:hypothetical protein